MRPKDGKWCTWKTTPNEPVPTTRSAMYETFCMTNRNNINDLQFEVSQNDVLKPKK